MKKKLSLLFLSSLSCLFLSASDSLSPQKNRLESSSSCESNSSVRSFSLEEDVDTTGAPVVYVMKDEKGKLVKCGFLSGTLRGEKQCEDGKTILSLEVPLKRRKGNEYMNRTVLLNQKGQIDNDQYE